MHATWQQTNFVNYSTLFDHELCCVRLHFAGPCSCPGWFRYAAYYLGSSAITIISNSYARGLSHTTSIGRSWPACHMLYAYSWYRLISGDWPIIPLQPGQVIDVQTVLTQLENQLTADSFSQQNIVSFVSQLQQVSSAVWVYNSINWHVTCS